MGNNSDSPSPPGRQPTHQHRDTGGEFGGFRVPAAYQNLIHEYLGALGGGAPGGMRHSQKPGQNDAEKAGPKKGSPGETGDPAKKGSPEAAKPRGAEAPNAKMSKDQIANGGRPVPTEEMYAQVKANRSDKGDKFGKPIGDVMSEFPHPDSIIAKSKGDKKPDPKKGTPGDQAQDPAAKLKDAKVTQISSTLSFAPARAGEPGSVSTAANAAGDARARATEAAGTAVTPEQVKLAEAKAAEAKAAEAKAAKLVEPSKPLEQAPPPARAVDAKPQELPAPPPRAVDAKPPEPPAPPRAVDVKPPEPPPPPRAVDVKPLEQPAPPSRAVDVKPPEQPAPPRAVDVKPPEPPAPPRAVDVKPPEPPAPPRAVDAKPPEPPPPPGAVEPAKAVDLTPKSTVADLTAAGSKLEPSQMAGGSYGYFWLGGEQKANVKAAFLAMEPAKLNEAVGAFKSLTSSEVSNTVRLLGGNSPERLGDMTRWLGNPEQRGKMLDAIKSHDISSQKPDQFYDMMKSAVGPEAPSVKPPEPQVSAPPSDRPAAAAIPQGEKPVSPVVPQDRPQTPAPPVPQDRPQTPAPPVPQDRPQTPAPPVPQDRPQAPAPPVPLDRPQSPVQRPPEAAVATGGIKPDRAKPDPASNSDATADMMDKLTPEQKAKITPELLEKGITTMKALGLTPDQMKALGDKLSPLMPPGGDKDGKGFDLAISALSKLSPEQIKPMLDFANSLKPNDIRRLHDFEAIAAKGTQAPPDTETHSKRSRKSASAAEVAAKDTKSETNPEQSIDQLAKMSPQQIESRMHSLRKGLDTMDKLGVEPKELEALGQKFKLLLPKGFDQGGKGMDLALHAMDKLSADQIRPILNFARSISEDDAALLQSMGGSGRSSADASIDKFSQMSPRQIQGMVNQARQGLPYLHMIQELPGPIRGFAMGMARGYARRHNPF